MMRPSAPTSADKVEARAEALLRPMKVDHCPMVTD
jgi:hypothetical protein